MKKHILILATLASFYPGALWSQTTSTAFDAGDFYDWFQSHSNASELYSDRSTLYAFAAETPVYAEPCESSEPIRIVKRGCAFTNTAYGVEDFIPTAEINGYHDMWYQITLTGPRGMQTQGYVWGGHIAKAWHRHDIDQDGETEFILFGVSQNPRRSLRDIHASILVLKGGALVAETDMPGMCLFEECTSDALLRTFTDRVHGIPFLEASTLSIGCMAHIERSFLIWKGDKLECIYYGELTSGTTHKQLAFAVRPAEGQTSQVCEFQGIDADFNPLWECKERTLKPSTTVDVP